MTAPVPGTTLDRLPKAILDNIASHGTAGGCNAVLITAEWGAAPRAALDLQDRYSIRSQLLGMTTSKAGKTEGSFVKLEGRKLAPYYEHATTCYMSPAAPGAIETRPASYAFFSAMAELHLDLPAWVTEDRSFWNGEQDAIGWVRVRGNSVRLKVTAPSISHPNGSKKIDLEDDDANPMHRSAGLLGGEFLCVTRTRGSSSTTRQLDVITAGSIATTTVDLKEPQTTYRFSVGNESIIQGSNLTTATLEKSPLDIIRRKTHIVPVAVKLKLHETRGGRRLYAFVPDLRSIFRRSTASKEAALTAHVLRQKHLAKAQIELAYEGLVTGQPPPARSANMTAVARRFVPQAGLLAADRAQGN